MKEYILGLSIVVGIVCLFSFAVNVSIEQGNLAEQQRRASGISVIASSPYKLYKMELPEGYVIMSNTGNNWGVFVPNKSSNSIEKEN